MGKKEICRYEQFLLFPWYFQKTCTVYMQKSGLEWERVNSLPNDKFLDSTKLKTFADNKLRVADDFSL